MMPWLAALPILLLLGLLLLARRPLLLAASVALASASIVAVAFWDLPVPRLLGALLKGAGVGLDVILIVFGAIFFLKYLEKIRILASIEIYIQRLSPDRRIQAVLVAWLFGSFIEGSAGFGTPAAIVAPLLLSIGFPLLCSIAVALVANSTAVTFGAVGTPLRIGLADFETSNIALRAAEINLVTGPLVPLLIIGLVVWQAHSGERWRALKECIPWALWAGLAFVGFAYFFAHLGPEFPSILGSLCALIVVAASLRFRFLVPQRVFNFEDGSKRSSEKPIHSALQAAAPYLLLVTLLVGGKFGLQNLEVELSLPGELIHRIKIFNPGFAFLSAAILIAIARRRFSSELRAPVVDALSSLVKPALSIFAIVAFVQVLMATEGLGSHGNTPGMLTNLVSNFSAENIVPLFSVAIGAFGSFVAGSATVSNLLFAPLQAKLASAANQDLNFILALQLLGAAIGNIIALPNILAVGATVGASNKEATILGIVIGPFAIYLVFVTLYALWLVP